MFVGPGMTRCQSTLDCVGVACGAFVGASPVKLTLFETGTTNQLSTCVFSGLNHV